MAETIRTLADFKSKFSRDAEFRERFTNDPEGTFREEMGTPLQTDEWVYRIVVIALGLAVLLSVFGAFQLSLRELTAPDILLAVASASVGALAGLLAPSPRPQ